MPNERSWLLGSLRNCVSAGSSTFDINAMDTASSTENLLMPYTEADFDSNNRNPSSSSLTGPVSRSKTMQSNHVEKDPERNEPLPIASDSERNETDETNGVPLEDDALRYMVSIPELPSNSDLAQDRHQFSWRKLWAFTGPGFLMSIAYLDPGNIESDLQSGAVARYQLLWVLLSAHILGFFLQRLSSRLGVTSGRNLAEMAYEFYPRVPRIFVWLMIEIAIIGSDMQEVIGTAIAFALLSNRIIPLFVGVLITMADTFTFLMIDRYGFRKLEVLFAFLISMMALSFGYEFFLVKPEAGALIEGMLVPMCAGCGREEFLQAVSIVGAVIMPHNLYLHSALVKSRRIDRSRKVAVKEANFYYFIESGVALICSFFINMFVVAVFAHGLHGKTNKDVFDECRARPEIFDQKAFKNDTNPVEADIYKGGIFLGCQFGLAALYIWGIGIMAAGQSSTMTGTYAGQYVMEGFLQIRWPRWRRVLFTRAIAIGPTLIVALMARGVENLTHMNDLLNCVQMIQLPFALLPVLTFASHPRIMFEFRVARGTQFFALLASLLVISINLYFSAVYVSGELGYDNWFTWLLLSVVATIYMISVLYLLFTCLEVMGIVSRATLERCLPAWLRPLDSAFQPLSPWNGGSKTKPTHTQSTLASEPEQEGSRGGGEGNVTTSAQKGKGRENVGFANSVQNLANPT